MYEICQHYNFHQHTPEIIQVNGMQRQIGSQFIETQHTDESKQRHSSCNKFQQFLLKHWRKNNLHSLAPDFGQGSGTELMEQVDNLPKLNILR